MPIQMRTALFVFKVRNTYKDKKTQETHTVERVNYINPLAFNSAYWEERTPGVKVLNVFTNGSYVDRETGESRNGRTWVFGEREGERFMDHVEQFYEYLLWSNPVVATPPVQEKPREKRSWRSRVPADVEVMEEIVDTELPASGEAQFE